MIMIIIIIIFWLNNTIIFLINIYRFNSRINEIIINTPFEESFSRDAIAFSVGNFCEITPIITNNNNNTAAQPLKKGKKKFGLIVSLWEKETIGEQNELWFRYQVVE